MCQEETMKKSVFLLLVGVSVMSQLFGHVDLSNPQGGETFHPGEEVNVEWVETQSHELLNWDLLFSMDGGLSWDTVKADITLESRSYQWTVPETTTVKGQIRIVQDNVGDDYYGTSQNFTVVTATGIVDPLYSIQMNIYPNPLRDYTSIEFENSKHLNHTLTVYDSQGRIVRSIHNITSGTVRVERNNLTSGLYIIRLRDENEIRAIGKLVIE
jgi:hypothetical protein